MKLPAWLGGAVLGVAFSVSGQAAAFRGDYGILLMAHGGAPAWQREVLKVKSELDGKAPVAVAFGMADAGALQAGIDELQARGVKKIVAVPLFVSSHSEVLDHTRFLLGLRAEPSKILVEAMAHMPHAPGMPPMAMSVSLTPVRAKVPIAMTDALDDDALVFSILDEHARALSREPRKDTLILVGHGPVDEAANGLWLKTLDALARRIQAREGFRAAEAATLRDDARPAVKRQAAEVLRTMVAGGAKEGGRAVVVPDLIAREGVEGHVVEELEGLDYAWDGRTLLPHAGVADWVLRRARAGDKAPRK